MTLILSGDITLRRTWQPMDPDAAAYITAVESADGQALEEPVKIAIDNFVLGCKADGIWDAIKASCILAGARTLDGALVPLVGAAPDKYGTEGNWNYNRKTGLQGDGSTNYLDSNQTATVTSPTNYHQSAYVSAKPSVNTAFVASDNVNDQRYLLYSNISADETRAISGRLGTAYFGGAGSLEIGFKGVTRNSSTTFNARSNAITSPPISSAAGNSTALTSFIFATNFNGAPIGFGNARLAFYSIGESLDLALLDARVTQLMSDIGAAIP